jgi:hypothetical protein
MTRRTKRLQSHWAVTPWRCHAPGRCVTVDHAMSAGVVHGGMLLRRCLQLTSTRDVGASRFFCAGSLSMSVARHLAACPEDACTPAVLQDVARLSNGFRPPGAVPLAAGDFHASTLADVRRRVSDLRVHARTRSRRSFLCVCATSRRTAERAGMPF